MPLVLEAFNLNSAVPVKLNFDMPCTLPCMFVAGAQGTLPIYIANIQQVLNLRLARGCLAHWRNVNFCVLAFQGALTMCCRQRACRRGP